MDHPPVTPLSQTTTVKNKPDTSKLKMAASTDVGTVRTANEDFFYFSQSLRLAMVCDGMGGLQAGAAASRMAGKTIRDVFSMSDLAMLAHLCDDVNDKLPSLGLQMAAGIRLANRRLHIMSKSDSSLKGMGTTIAAMVISQNMVCLAHVGDSRIYLLRDSMLMQLTQDHSWINELLEDQEIKQDEVQHFRKKNVLTRALGTHPAIKIDLQVLPLEENDVFLICSDGLHNVLGKEHMLTILLEHGANPQTAADTLVQRAKAADGSDNITAVVVGVEGEPEARTKPQPLSIVLPEEEPRLYTLEDRFLRERYPSLPKDGGAVSNRRKVFWAGVIAGLVLLIAVILYALWQRSVAADFSRPGAKATNFAAANTARNTANTKDRKAGNRKSITVADENLKIDGQVYLVGLDAFASSDAEVFANEVRIAPLRQAVDSGIFLTPGTYNLAIKDSAGRILLRKANLEIRKGDVKAVEFTR